MFAARGPIRILLTLVILLACAAGCEGERTQSMLHPAGPEAQRVATLWWVMLTVYGAIFLATMVLLAAALWAPRRTQSRLGSRFVITTGIVLPTLILTAMLFYTILLTRHSADREATFHVQVIAHRWWWEVRYPDYGIIDANEIHLPVGERVAIELRSADVIHSFWVPNLAGKLDMLPEHATTLHLQADRPGVYRGQCAEFCGTQHALMAFRVVAHKPDEMRAWLARHRTREPGADDSQVTPVSADASPAATEPDIDEAERASIVRGRDVFAASGCSQCHRIAGVSDADAAPDLTLMGSRLTIGAGVFENTDENMDRWIDDPQAMKPGILMPPTPMSAEDRRALVNYMRSLK